MTVSNRYGRLCLIGDPPDRFFGLLRADWQRRAWRRAGVEGAEGLVLASSDWALSPDLAAALVARPGAALVAPSASGRRLVAAHARDETARLAVEALIQHPDVAEAEIEALGLRPETAAAFADAGAERDQPFAIGIDQEGVEAAEAAYFRAVYPSPADIVTEAAWPAPSLAAVRWCAARRISPHAVTTVGLLSGLLAFLVFWSASWLLGFVFAAASLLADVADGQLARVAMKESRLGAAYRRATGAALPALWLWAWFEGGAGADGAPLWLGAAFAVALLAHAAALAVEELFRRAHGFEIREWAPEDAALRRFGAGRNVTTLVFMVFCVLGAPGLGLVAVALHSLATAGLLIRRFRQAGGASADPPPAPYAAD
ncbi:MAG: CDP-alcohol phosphatidyltransferase family protein [Pseudomonadota bacterium]